MSLPEIPLVPPYTPKDVDPQQWQSDLRAYTLRSSQDALDNCAAYHKPSVRPMLGTGKGKWVEGKAWPVYPADEAYLQQIEKELRLGSYAAR